MISVSDFKTKPEKAPVYFAQVTDVGYDGVQLLIDGEDTPTAKYYRVMKPYVPEVGDRVFVNYVAGTILVMGAV